MILGANKSGTSTACAIANVHVDVFCLYEIDFSRPASRRRNPELVALLPESEKLFESNCQLSITLEHLYDILVSRGYNLNFVGTKIAGLRPDLFSETQTPTLYVVREVRNWAAKNRVITGQIGSKPGKNVVPAIAAYVSSFVMSFLYPHIKRVRFDDLFSDVSSMPRSIADFFKLEKEVFVEWWNKVAWKQELPKNYSDWIEGHRSAFIPPIASDTTSKISSHEFWKKILPIFDKYYSNIDKEFPRHVVEQDLKKVNQIWDNHKLTLNEAFESFRSVKIKDLQNLSGDQYQLTVQEVISKEPGKVWRKMY